MDLAEVNGRVFVNNVSLGLYAEAVQRGGYRDAKLRTLLDTVPDVLGPEGSGLDLRWTGPGGQAHRAGAAVLVSNNLYRLGRAVGSGTRPRIDDGLLGLTVIGGPPGAARTAAAAAPDGASGRRRRSRSTPTGPSPAGIDGEALVLEPPLNFRIRPACCACGRPPAPGRLALGGGPRGPGPAGASWRHRLRREPTSVTTRGARWTRWRSARRSG